MIVKNESALFFYFAFTEEEQKSPQAKKAIEKLKKIPYGQRYWYPKESKWSIHKNHFLTFVEIMATYWNDILDIGRQGGLYDGVE